MTPGHHSMKFGALDVLVDDSEHFGGALRNVDRLLTQLLGWRCVLNQVPNQLHH